MKNFGYNIIYLGSFPLTDERVNFDLDTVKAIMNNPGALVMVSPEDVGTQILAPAKNEAGFQICSTLYYKGEFLTLALFVDKNTGVGHIYHNAD